MEHITEIVRLVQEELTAVEAQLAALEPLLKKKAALEAMLQNAAALANGGPTTNGAGAPTVGATDRPDAGTTPSGGAPTITFVATKILNQFRRPMTAPEITRELIKAGFKMTANNPIEVVRSTLIRRGDRFEKVDTGLYGLTGWQEAWKQRRVEVAD